MSAGVRGRYMDGRSAADRVVLVFVEGENLVVSTAEEGVVARFALRELRVAAVGEGRTLHIEPEKVRGALLTVEDAELRDRLAAAGLCVRSISSGRRAVFVGVASGVLFAGILGAVHWGAPFVSEKLAHRVPLSTERALAPQVTKMLESNTCHTDAADRALRVLAERLEPGVTRNVDLRIVDMPFENAFALPGGVIVVTRGLVEHAESSDEIAGVLAHELAHVEHRHVLAHMIRNTALGILWTATLGDYSGLMVVDPKTAYDVAILRYSREAEAEADATALRTLSTSGISSAGLVRFFERNAKESSDGPTFLASHPAPEDRVARLSSQARTGRETPALSADDLYELRKACESARRVVSVRELFFGGND